MGRARPSLDVDAWGADTYAKLISTGWKVVDQATMYAMKRAKEHAPVRRVFVGQHRRKSGLSPAEARAKRINAAYKNGARGVALPVVSDEEAQYRSQRSWHPKTHRMSIEGLPAPLPSGSRKTINAHANSMFPALRPSRDPKTWRRPGIRGVGDFRRIGAPDAEGKPTLATVPTRYTFMGSDGKMTSRKGQSSGQSMLSSRGRWELERSKRAHYTGPDGVTRLGGRLRGEISFRVASTDGVITMEVYSPTPYAAPQEYGSSHNRPHPFLRPALYETRERFRNWARQAYSEMGLRGRNVKKG